MPVLSSNNNNISLLFSLLFLLLLVKNVSSQNTNFSINYFTPHSTKLIYELDAVVPPDEPFVRLTPSEITFGRVLYKEPVTFRDYDKQLSFETTITLQITPSAGYPVEEGMTFFIVPFNSTLPIDGYGLDLGIYGSLVPGSPIFAVQFDCARNGSFFTPYPYIGININSYTSQNVTRFENATGQLVTARITYDAPTRKINVVATYGSTTATVTFFFNLAAILPKQVQLGLSASTDYHYTHFDAYTWHFNSTMVPEVHGNNDTYVKQFVM